MIYKNRTYRKTEENSASTPTLEGRLAALDNFGGGGSATAEIREELKATEVAPVAEKPTETITESVLNSDLGATEDVVTEAPASETPVADTESFDTVKIESDMFEGGELDLGIKAGETPAYSDDINKFVSDFGFDSTADFETKLSEYKTNTEKVAELSKQVESNNDLYKNMPTEMYNGVVAYFNGDKDWKNQITNDGIDYAGALDTHTKQGMVDTFHPGSFSEDDWEEYNDVDGDANVKKAIDIAYTDASSKYEAKQNEINNYQAGVTHRQTQTQELVDNSIGSTISNLSTQMNGLSESYVKNIESKIRNNEIMSLFYEQDGSLKPDAAHRLILAQDGNDLIKKYSTLYKTQANNEATQEILDRSADTPNTTQGGSSTAKTEQRSVIQQGIDSLESRFNKKNTF